MELAMPGSLPPTARSYWVVEGRFLAGAYPGSLHEDERESKVRALLDAGIRTFISLMEEDEVGWGGQAFVPYDTLACSLGQDEGMEVTCLRFAVRDVSIPTVPEMVKILDAIDASLADGRPVYLHCWGGVGRTGTAVCCWLLRHRLATRENVLEILRRLREADVERRHRVSPEAQSQRRFVLSWAGQEQQ
jgi:hypothetical protein